MTWYVKIGIRIHIICVSFFQEIVHHFINGVECHFHAIVCDLKVIEICLLNIRLLTSFIINGTVTFLPLFGYYWYHVPIWTQRKAAYGYECE